MDVGLEQGVSYETAAKIVLAIKRRTFVDRRKRVEETPVGKELLLVPAYVRQVGGEYEVMMGKTGGLTLRVAVVGERLELISVDVWIS